MASSSPLLALASCRLAALLLTEYMDIYIATCYFAVKARTKSVRIGKSFDLSRCPAKQSNRLIQHVVTLLTHTNRFDRSTCGSPSRATDQRQLTGGAGKYRR